MVWTAREERTWQTGPCFSFQESEAFAVLRHDRMKEAEMWSPAVFILIDRDGGGLFCFNFISLGFWSHISFIEICIHIKEKRKPRNSFWICKLSVHAFYSFRQSCFMHKFKQSQLSKWTSGKFVFKFFFLILFHSTKHYHYQTWKILTQ